MFFYKKKNQEPIIHHNRRLNKKNTLKMRKMIQLDNHELIKKEYRKQKPRIAHCIQSHRTQEQ